MIIKLCLANYQLQCVQIRLIKFFQLLQHSYIDIMSQSDAVKQILREAKQIRQRCDVRSSELYNYLQAICYEIESKRSSLWVCGLCTRPEKGDSSRQLVRALRAMNKMEQAEFYLMNVKHVEKFMNSQQNRGGPIKEVMHHEIPTGNDAISIVFEINDDRNYSKAAEVSAKISKSEKCIDIAKTKEKMDLHLYLLRKSNNKKKRGLVLESTHPNNYAQTVRMFFSSIDFEDSFNLIYNLWSEAHFENISRKIVASNGFKKAKLMKSNGNLTSMQTLAPIQTSQTERKYTMGKSQAQGNQTSLLKSTRSLGKLGQPKPQSQLVSDQLIQSLDNFNQFQLSSYGIYYSKYGDKVRKILEIPKNKTSIEQLTHLIDEVKGIRRRKQNITQIKQVSSIPSERTNIYREVHLIGVKQFEFVYFRHHFTKDKVSYFFQKSVELEQFRNRVVGIRGEIKYCLWRIRETGQNIEIVVEAEVNYQNKTRDAKQITSEYIGSFPPECFQPQIIKQAAQESIKSQQFEVEYLSEINSQNQQFYSLSGTFLSELTGQDRNLEMVLNPKQNQDSQDANNKDTTVEYNSPLPHLRHKYMVQPAKKGDPEYDPQPSGHILFGSAWQITKEGELKNLETEKIQAQSKVLKSVVQRMGKNLLSGKGIMGVSLPIQVFGDDSNLQRLSRRFLYAPMFLQRAAQCEDPVQRIKIILAFIMSACVSYMQMDKPFNPILGQTYQATIDGCPVYAEQVSHHPPICRLLMMGRGYRCYGSFQDKINLGLNSASGVTEGFTHIEFGGGEVVKFTTPHGEISGTIIGDRNLCLIKPTYVIDEANHLFCELHWGKDKTKGREISKMKDYVHGKVLKLRPGFNIKDNRKVKSNDIQYECGELYGRYTGKTYFNGEQIMDVGEQAPFRIVSYSPCLESDSTLRKDIIIWRKRDVQKSQQAKQELENVQRNDAKLRKKYRS